MDEFDTIMEKYGDCPLREHFESLDEISSSTGTRQKSMTVSLV